MTTVFHARLYGRFIKVQSNPKRQKHHRTNQSSNLFGSSFRDRDNVRAPIRFRREKQRQHLKKYFSEEQIPPYHINSTSIIRPAKRNKLSFRALKSTSHFLPQFLVDQIQVQQPTLVVATDQMPNHTQHRQKYYR